MLNDKQDAYGHQLYDCFRGDNVVEVVERDDGFIDSSTSLPKYYLADYKNWRAHEKNAMRYASGRMLDIGCGGGRKFPLFLKKRLARPWEKTFALAIPGFQPRRPPGGPGLSNPKGRATMGES